MNIHRVPIRKAALIAAVLFSAVAPIFAASELPVAVGDNIEIGDRLRIRSRVMRVDPGKQTLLVAEKEVRLLEHFPEGRNLRTRLLKEDGKAAAFGYFKEGDMVLVLGYSDSEGHVYAMKVQRVDPNAPAYEPPSNHSSQFQRAKTRKTVSEGTGRSSQPADNPK